jgi:hypothetical protein
MCSSCVGFGVRRARRQRPQEDTSTDGSSLHELRAQESEHQKRLGSPNLQSISDLSLFYFAALVLALEYADRAAKDPEKMAALMEAAFMGSMYGDSGPKVTPQSPIRRPEARSMALEALYAELARDENDGVLVRVQWRHHEAWDVRKCQSVVTG